MTTRREALIAAGLAKPGRGKFSREAMAWLETERANGTKFSDDSAAPVVSAKKGPTKNSDAPSKNTENGFVDYVFPSDFRFPENEYVAFAREGNKKVFYSMREACNNCMVSLVNHGCNSPVIHGNIILTIERK